MSELPTELANAAKILFAAPVRGVAQGRFLEPGFHLTIIADQKTQDIGEAMRRAAEQMGATATLISLDGPKGSRPDSKRALKVLPPAVREALAKSKASAYIASAPLAERPVREQLVSLIKACNLRHAHLPDVTERAFAYGLKVEIGDVMRAGKAIRPMMESGTVVEVDSPRGTELKIGTTRDAWVERLGEIVPGKSVAFPSGCLFTSSASIDGMFVADASLGEYFGAREGLLIDSPVRFHIEKSHVVRVEGAPQSSKLLEDLQAMLDFGKSSSRVGLLALGVNAGLRWPTGDSSVDQNLPGLHLFIGDPSNRTTGAGWSARTSFAACQADSRVRVDGRVVIEKGKLVLPEAER